MVSALAKCVSFYARAPPLKNPLASLELRTTEGMCADHGRFLENGGIHKKAKFFNNSIREPLFKNIPIDQVHKKNTMFATYLSLRVHMYM